jgi:hypothetical protein
MRLQAGRQRQIVGDTILVVQLQIDVRHVFALSAT